MIEPDRIIRSARKSLSVSVDAFGKVTVRAPKNCSSERIYAFLQDKEGWILKHKQKRDGAAALLPTENLDGFTFLLLGEEHRVSLYDGKRISYDKSTRVISVPSDAPEVKIRGWIKENAKRIFKARTLEWAEKMGLIVSSVSVTSAKKRWGSCSYNKGAIRYTYRLLYAPKECVDYVIVHELCHLKEHGHDARFWAYVEKTLPDYKRRDKWLKDHAYLLHIF